MRKHCFWLGKIKSLVVHGSRWDSSTLMSNILCIDFAISKELEKQRKKDLLLYWIFLN